MTTLPLRRRCRPVPRISAPLPSVELAQSRKPLRLAQIPMECLREPARNVRRYSKRQMAALKVSLKRFGMVRPILVARDGTIIAGVAIWLAAKELEYTTIPVVYAESLTAEEQRLYRLADQKLSTLGEYNEEALKLEFLELTELALNLELNLDLQVTGFKTGEIDAIVLKEDPVGPDQEDDTQPCKVPISRKGDLWLIGDEHRILCGNSLEEGSYQTVLDGELAQMIVSDGPFNVPIRGHVSSKKDAREFQFASGGLSSDEFITFQRTVFRLLTKYSIDGSIHYHFIDWRSVFEMLAAGREVYDELKNILVWVKQNASRGFYRSQYELCCVFKHGTAPHICTFALEEGARWRSNVLTGYPGCNSFGAHRDEDLAAHPTVKNTSLFGDLLRDCSTLGGCVLDPFSGSGTLLQAAHLTRRRARMIEIDPLYVDVTIRRAAKRCGLSAVLAATGQTFEEVARERLSPIELEQAGFAAVTSDHTETGSSEGGADND